MLMIHLVLAEDILELLLTTEMPNQSCTVFVVPYCFISYLTKLFFFSEFRWTL